MALKLSGILIIFSVISSFFTGNTSVLTQSAISGGEKAITTVMYLMPLMCLWGGIMAVCEKVGALNFLSRMFSPILKHIFPYSKASKTAMNKISAAFCANILGVGNACTPLSLEALNQIKKENGEDCPDIKTFTVLSCAPPCFFPTTVITLSSAMGSKSASDILLPVWAVSLILFTISAVLCRLLGSVKK